VVGPGERVPSGAPAPASPGGEPPWWNAANLLTVLRVFLVPVIGWLLILDHETARWWAFGIFLFAAWTDSIDGWLARRLVGVTRWGQLADPLADKALIVGTLAILAWVGPLPWWAVAVIIVREVAVTAQRTMLVRRGVVMPASIFGKAKTLSQIFAITLYLLPEAPAQLRETALVVAVVITVLSGIEYAFRGKRLQRAG
jgi:CDP-diacylglycerol---glycerol-3-phosphate 3-phosphatidyltransferase